MKKLAMTITLVIFLIPACKSVEWNPFYQENPETSYEKIVIDREVGCARYRGRERQKCIDMELKDYENIHNAKPTEKVLRDKEYREGNYIYQFTEVCWGNYLCKVRKQKLYDPDIYTLLWKYGVLIGGGIAVGFYGGINVAAKIVFLLF